MDTIKSQLSSIKENLSKTSKIESKRVLTGVFKELDVLKSDIRKSFKQKNLVYVNEVQWWPKNLQEFYSYTFNVHDGIRKYEPTSTTECLFHPLSMFSQLWSSLFMIYLCIYTVLLPNFLGNDDLDFGLVPLSISLTVMIILDTVITIKTGIILEQELEMEQKTVTNYHIQKKTLIWNFITCIPYVAFVGADINPWKPICILNGYAFVRYLKSNRTSYLTELHKKVFIDYNLNHQLKNVALVVIAMFVYWCWYGAGMNYMQFLNVVTYEDSLDSEQYFTSFFEAFCSVFSTQWAVYLAFTKVERWLKVFNILVVVVILAFFTANVTTYVYQLDSTLRNFDEKISQIKQFIRYKNLGLDLEEKIMQYYLFKFPKRRYFDEEKLLNQLNEPLRKDIAMKQCRTLILQVPFFKQADHSFISQIITYLKIEHYLSGDVIIEQGSYGDEMFFIFSGYVEIIMFGKSVGVLKAGQFFGEIAILLGMTNRTATVRAISNCVIYSLSQSDLDLVIDSNPEMSDIIKTTAEARLASDKAKREKENGPKAKLESTLEVNENESLKKEAPNEVAINILENIINSPQNYSKDNEKDNTSPAGKDDRSPDIPKVGGESSADDYSAVADEKTRALDRTSSISISMNKAAQLKKMKNKEIMNERNLGVLKHVQMINKSEKQPQLLESDLQGYPQQSNSDEEQSFSPSSSQKTKKKVQRTPDILDAIDSEPDISTTKKTKKSKAQSVPQEIKAQPPFGENGGRRNTFEVASAPSDTKEPDSGYNNNTYLSPILSESLGAQAYTEAVDGIQREAPGAKDRNTITEEEKEQYSTETPTVVVSAIDERESAIKNKENDNKFEFSINIEQPKEELPPKNIQIEKQVKSGLQRSPSNTSPIALKLSHDILQTQLGISYSPSNLRKSSLQVPNNSVTPVPISEHFKDAQKEIFNAGSNVKRGGTRSRSSSTASSKELKAQRAVGVLHAIRNRTPSAVTGINTHTESDKEQFSAILSSVKEIKEKNSFKSTHNEEDKNLMKNSEIKELEKVVVSVKIDTPISEDGVISNSKKSFLPRTLSDDNIQRRSFDKHKAPKALTKQKSLPKQEDHLTSQGNKSPQDSTRKSRGDFRPDRYQSAYLSEIQELEKIQNEEITSIIGSIMRRQSLNTAALADTQRSSRSAVKDPRLSQIARRSSVLSGKRRPGNKSTGSDSSNVADQIVEFIAKTSRSTSKASDFILPVDEDDEEVSAAKEEKQIAAKEPQEDAMSDMGSGIVSDTGRTAPPKRKKIVNQVLLNAPVEYSRAELLKRFWNKYQPSTSYCPLTPFTPFSQYFYSVYIIVFLITSILVPFTIAFPEVNMLLGISLTVCIISTFEVLIKLQTCYYSEKGPETVPSKVFLHHLKNGNLIFDLICGLPWVFLVDMYENTNEAVRLICLVHIFPVYRIFSTNRPTWIGENILYIVRKYSINVSGFQAGKILCAMILYWHWKTCIKVLMDRYQDVSYPMFMEDDGYMSVYTLYFWSVAGEAMYSSSGARFHELMEEVEQYIDYMGLGVNLKQKIRHYYNLKYSLGKYFDENRILEELNHPLRLSICMKECRPLILKVPFFRDADNGFLSQVVMILKLTYFLPGDMVIEKGTVGDLMFFIASGTLEVVVDVKPIAQLNPGQFFGAGEDIKAQVGKFHNELLQIKAQLTGMRNVIDNLPENEAKSAMIALNKDVDLLKDFLADDLNVKLTAEEIRATSLAKKWFPKNLKQFMQYQYDANRGLIEYESTASHQCAIHPLSLMSQLWCSLYSLCILLYAILLPLSLAYPYKHEMLLPLSIYIMAIVIVDTVMVLNTGIIVEQELEMYPKFVYQYHLDSKLFIWNVILGFPYIVIIDAAVQPPGSTQNMNWSLICMLNAFIVLRMFTSTRVSWISEMATKFIRKWEINSAIVKSISILSGMALYWHWFTCAVYFLQLRGVVSDLNPTLQTEEYEFEHYTISFFEASSIMFSSGWGVAGPTLTSDRWSKIFNMLLSAFLLALFTANITTFMLRLDSSGRQFTEKLEEVNQYIKYKGLGRDLQQRIVHYYHFKYSKGKYFDEEKILAELNHPLRVVPFFKDADHTFITQVVSQLKVNHFLHDDFIIEQGTTGDQMFFIASGIVEVIVEGKTVTTLKAGQFFGEISLLFGNIKRTASIRAITECVLYSLGQGDLEIILDLNPNMAAMMRKTAEERIASNKVEIVMLSKNTPALIDRTYSIGNMSRKNSLFPVKGALDILAEKKRRVSQMQSGNNSHFHTSTLEAPIENEAEEELPSIPINPQSPFYATDAASKSKILEQVENSEIKEVLSAVKRKSSVQNFVDRSFINKHISVENMNNSEILKSIEFLGSKNSKRSILSLTVPEEKILPVSVPVLSIAEDKETKPAPKDGSGKIIASAEAATPSNDVKIDLDKEKDDFDDEEAKPKATPKKIMQQTIDNDPVKSGNNTNTGNFDQQTFSQKLTRLWSKYQPSTSYCPLHPNSLFSRIANSVFTIIYLIVAIVLPISFGFETQTDVLPSISVVVFITSCFDFVLKLQTGYKVHQEVEMEPKKLIAIYWLNGSFLVDFITGIPWVFVVDAVVADPVQNSWWRLICFVHAFPLIRILVGNRSSWIADYMTDWVRRNDVNVSAVQAGKILFTMSLYWHWHTCSANFLIRMQVIPNAFPIYGEADMYTLHFWSSATEMLNTGCGAVPPKVPLDRWLKILNMICNVSLMSLFVGNISSFMIGLDSSGRQFNEQLEQVGQYITYKGLGRELKKKILDYYQLKYSLGKYFDETKILSELNHPLRLAIYMRECRALIIQVPFFKGADNGFISQVVMILKPAHFLKDDLVIEKGTAGDLMFFIASGTLEVVVNNVAVAQLSPGQFFGDLNFILEVYPEMAEKMQKIAEERIANNLGKKD
ncbi:hypothetical protein HDV01_005664 [Terramyces sp. JEL0728]|nr:hypothetical protein HDV01_005664 [Terramyces sp. JEL0728]